VIGTDADFHIASHNCEFFTKLNQISFVLAGADEDEYNLDYDSTHTPEYDYNSTFGFLFFSRFSMANNVLYGSVR